MTRPTGRGARCRGIPTTRTRRRRVHRNRKRRRARRRRIVAARTGRRVPSREIRMVTPIVLRHSMMQVAAETASRVRNRPRGEPTTRPTSSRRAAIAPTTQRRNGNRRAITAANRERRSHQATLQRHPRPTGTSRRHRARSSQHRIGTTRSRHLSKGHPSSRVISLPRSSHPARLVRLQPNITPAAQTPMQPPRSTTRRVPAVTRNPSRLRRPRRRTRHRHAPRRRRPPHSHPMGCRLNPRPPIMARPVMPTRRPTKLRLPADRSKPQRHRMIPTK